MLLFQGIGLVLLLAGWAIISQPVWRWW